MRCRGTKPKPGRRITISRPYGKMLTPISRSSSRPRPNTPSSSEDRALFRAASARTSIYADSKKVFPGGTFTSINPSPVSTKWNTLDTTNYLFTGKGQLYGVHGGIRRRSWKLREPRRKLDRTMSYRTLIFGARRQSRATMSRRPTAKLGMLKTSYLTTRPGRFATRSWIRRTFGRVRGSC